MKIKQFVTEALTENQKNEFNKYLDDKLCIELIINYILTEEQKKKIFNKKIEYLTDITGAFDDLEHIKACFDDFKEEKSFEDYINHEIELEYLKEDDKYE